MSILCLYSIIHIINIHSSWYFGNITREKATEILNNEREGGVFLVRDSTTIIGDYVLCVR